MPAKKDHIIPETFGLVVCGGNSSRMQADKSLLIYHDKPQRYHIYEMLLPHCERVFLSCSEAQAGTITTGYHFLTDLPMYKDSGPLGALLTGLSIFPGKDILFIGCDYPFLTESELRHFLSHCKGEKAVSFYNEKEGLYEPLLAWYPERSVDQLKKMYAEKQLSLQQYLKVSTAIKFTPKNKKSITSIDTPAEFIKASEMIKA